MLKRLYVGNLGLEMTDAALREIFKPFGEVETAEVVIDEEKRRGRGFGFVEMATEQQAQAAVTGLAGREQGGRVLTIKEATARSASVGRRPR